ncbi:MAG: hypothetical protein WAV22_07930 [Porticoccaceae bacterium]
MDKVRRDSNTAAIAAVLLIVASAALTALLHWPGHMSVDTLLQLRDGLSRDYQSNQPPAMSWLVASMQRSPLGLGGLLLLNVGLWSACAWRLFRLLAGRGSWRRWAALLVWLLFPVTLLYNGVLWKDVLAAHLAALGFLLAVPARTARTSAWALAGSALLIAAATLVRQQMALVIPILGAAIWMASRARGPHRALGLTGLWLVGVLAATQLAGNALERSAIHVSELSTQGAIYQLTTFDLAGIQHQGGQVRTPSRAAAGMKNPERLTAMLALYGPDRVDHLGAYPDNPIIGVMNQPDWTMFLAADWWTSIRANPGAYAVHRWEHFLWQAGFRDTTACLPFYFGISPPSTIPPLPLPAGNPARDAHLTAWGHHLAPMFRPVIYATAALLALIGLCCRRPRGWEVLAALQVAGLAYLGSYLLIGIACDFRYAYFLVPVALIGILSLWLPRRARTSPGGVPP